MQKAIMLVLLMTLCASCGNNATPSQPPSAAAATPSTPDPRIIYDLRDKCGREAREWFKHFYGDGVSRKSDGESHSSYTNHYNERLNRCYALLASNVVIRDEQTHKIILSDQRALVDVSENKDIGNYLKLSDMDNAMACKIGEQKCSSLEEWESLAASYMDQ